MKQSNKNNMSYILDYDVKGIHNVFATLYYYVDVVQNKLFQNIDKLYTKISQLNEEKFEIIGENSSIHLAFIQESIEKDVTMLIVLDEFNENESHLIKVNLNLDEKESYEVEIISNIYPAKTRNKKEFNGRSFQELAGHIEAIEHVSRELDVFLS